MKSITKLLSRVTKIFIMFVLLAVNSSPAQAITDTQKKAFLGGALYANTEDTYCPGSSTVPLSGSPRVYMVGSSTTDFSRPQLQASIPAAGFTVTNINAVPNRRLTGGTGDDSANKAIQDDQGIIRNSDVVVVAIFNGGGTDTEDWNVEIPNLVNKIRSFNSTVRIFWATYFTTEQAESAVRANTIINNLATSSNYTVIDTANAGIEVSGDNIHPTEAGEKVFADKIASSLRENLLPNNAPSLRGKVFYIGDSLTYQLVVGNGQLLEKTAAAGYTVNTTYSTIGPGSRAPRISGESIEAQGGVNIANTLPHLADHPDDYKTADIIVIALGTNKEQLDFASQISTLISTIRTINSRAQIYWLNTYYSTPLTVKKTGYVEVNQVIASSALANNYKIIDYATASLADPTIAPEPYVAGSADGIHVVSAEKRQKKSDWIVSQLTSGGGGAQAPTTGNCACYAPGSSLPYTDTSSITWGEGVFGEGATIYQSNLPGPYTLEVWAISVLRNIAQKLGMSEASLVTQQKVLALIAFAQGEGGGVSGHNGTYNPLNTKLGHSDLNPVNQGNAERDQNSNGFPTFDIGVEASTRALFNFRQKRVGSALINPSTTPEQFVEAVAGDFYWDGNSTVNRWADRYPGDLAWATGSITGYVYDPIGGGTGNHDVYLRNKLNTLNHVRQNYDQVASKVLDLPGREPDTRTPVPPLVYTSDGTTGATLPGSCGSSSSTAGPNGWDLPGEGPNPLKYYYSQLRESSIKYKSYTDYYGPYAGFGGTCGPTSAAMVVSNLTGVKVEQPTMVKWFIDNGYKSGGGSDSSLFGVQSYIDKFESAWGVRSRRIPNNDFEQVKEELKKGNLVIISLKSPSPLVTGGDSAHITVIRAFTDDGKFLFADTSDSISKNNRYPILVNGSSRTALSPEELGPVNTGIYALEKTTGRQQ